LGSYFPFRHSKRSAAESRNPVEVTFNIMPEDPSIAQVRDSG